MQNQKAIEWKPSLKTCNIFHDHEIIFFTEVQLEYPGRSNPLWL